VVSSLWICVVVSSIQSSGSVLGLCRHLENKYTVHLANTKCSVSNLCFPSRDAGSVTAKGCLAVFDGNNSVKHRPRVDLFLLSQPSRLWVQELRNNVQLIGLHKNELLCLQLLLRPCLILVRAHLLVLIFHVYLYIGPSISGYRTHHGTCRYLDT
jgi:hypothetical protein